MEEEEKRVKELYSFFLIQRLEKTKQNDEELWPELIDLETRFSRMVGIQVSSQFKVDLLKQLKSIGRWNGRVTVGAGLRVMRIGRLQLLLKRFEKEIAFQEWLYFGSIFGINIHSAHSWKNLTQIWFSQNSVSTQAGVSANLVPTLILWEIWLAKCAHNTLWYTDEG